MRTCEECGKDIHYDELPDHLYGHITHLSETLDFFVKRELPRIRHQVTELFDAVLSRHRNHSPVFEDLCCRLVTNNEILYTVLTQARWFRLEDEDVPLKDQEPL